MAPIYMMPGMPRFRLPDFSVRISPVAPNSNGVPCSMARWIKLMMISMDQFPSPLTAADAVFSFL